MFGVGVDGAALQLDNNVGRDVFMSYYSLTCDTVIIS